MHSFQYNLRDTMEMNRQLSVCVQKKQEEISALKRRNLQLMELLKQPEFHTTTTTTHDPSPATDPPSALLFTPHSDSYCWITSDQHSSAAPQPAWLESLLHHTPPDEEDEWSHSVQSGHTDASVKRKLWPGDTESRGGDKKSRLDTEFFNQSETAQIFGSFSNYRVLKASPGLTSDPWKKGTCAFFKTSIREHRTIRTGVFPHGKTFTSHTDDGGCRFLWIPKLTQH